MTTLFILPGLSISLAITAIIIGFCYLLKIPIFHKDQFRPKPDISSEREDDVPQLQTKSMAYHWHRNMGKYEEMDIKAEKEKQQRLSDDLGKYGY